MKKTQRKQNTIRVISVPVGRQAYAKEIDRGLKALQNEVGGLIQVLYPFEDEIALICNDEGKLMGLPLNRALKMDGLSGIQIYDIISGDFLVAFAPSDSENFESMPDDLLRKYLAIFKYPERFLIKNQTIYIYPER